MSKMIIQFCYSLSSTKKISLLIFISLHYSPPSILLGHFWVVIKKSYLLGRTKSFYLDQIPSTKETSFPSLSSWSCICSQCCFCYYLFLVVVASIAQDKSWSSLLFQISRSIFNIIVACVGCYLPLCSSHPVLVLRLATPNFPLQRPDARMLPL